RLALIVAAVAVLTIPSSTSAADERSAPQAMADRLLNAPQPGRSPFDLAVRLRGLSTSTPLIAPVPAAVPLAVGFTATFSMRDQPTLQRARDDLCEPELGATRPTGIRFDHHPRAPAHGARRALSNSGGLGRRGRIRAGDANRRLRVHSAAGFRQKARCPADGL